MDRKRVIRLLMTGRPLASVEVQKPGHNTGLFLFMPPVIPRQRYTERQHEQIKADQVEPERGVIRNRHQNHRA